MSGGGCRSRCTRRLRRRSCGRGLRRRATTSIGEGRGVLGGGRTKKVKLETFLVFNQQFLTLIRAGLPILGSLELLARRQKNVEFRAQLEDVAARVKTGESISQAFEAQGGFPLVYTTTLLAGERSGNLEEVLQRYLDFQRVSLTFRKKLKASLIYPALLVVMVIALFIFLITFVVPRFAQLYDQLGTKLPALTMFLLELGQNAQHYGILCGGGAGAGGYLFYPVDEDGCGREVVDRVRIGLPVFGTVWLKYQVGLFSRTLSTLLTGGLPLVPSWRRRRGRSIRGRSGMRCTGAWRRCARERAVGESGGDEGVSGAGDRDDRGGREHGCAAADAELGGGVF